MMVFDAKFADRKKTRDGYLAVTGKVARGGNIQEYLGAEMPGAKDRGFADDDIISVYRPEDEVFSDGAMKSFAHRPVTLSHPSDMVDSKTWAGVSVGHSGDKVARDGEYIEVPMLLMDENAIRAVEDGDAVELSMGYNADIEWASGVTDGGKEYQAVQRNIRSNHIAIVDRARAGRDARIGDAGGQKDSRHQKDGDANMQTVVIDGLSVETTKQGAEAIAKLKDQVADAQTEIDKAVEDAATKDSDIAKKDAEIAKLKENQLDDAALDKMVKDRADLLASAKSVHDQDYSGKSPAEIRKAAVVAKLGDEAVKDKSESYIDARFDILVEDAEGSDPVRDNAGPQPVTDAQTEYEKRISNRWKVSANG